MMDGWKSKKKVLEETNGLRAWIYRPTRKEEKFGDGTMGLWATSAEEVKPKKQP